MWLEQSKNASRFQNLVCEMIIKVVSIFLIAMIVLAMFGKLRFPGQGKINARRCQKCKKFLIGTSECKCKKG